MIERTSRGPIDARAADLDALRSTTFDLLVIGGGVTGCGIARDAALRGLSVALVEKGDLASGTSSQSSKLLHGGVRYLEQWAFGLVMESIRERDKLAFNAPHLARRLPFLFPIHKSDKHSPFLINMGMWLYAAFAGFRRDRRHRMLSLEDIAKAEPELSTDELKSATLYFDCMTDDGRLTLETALDARAHGAVIVTRLEAKALVKDSDQVIGLRGRDLLATEPSAADIEVKAKATVSATGPWTDALLMANGVQSKPLLRPTRGVHLVVERDRLPVEHAVVMRSPDDQRVLFTIPWRERTVIGTTDTDDDQGPDACRATRADVDYLLRATERYFPNAHLTHADVISTWAGLRPLLRHDDADPSEISREHEIRALAPGLFAIFGGKLTTYRLMAEQVVDQTGLTETPSTTAELPLPGARSERLRSDPIAFGRDLASTHRLPSDVAEHLALDYGDRAEGILDLAAARGLGAERMIEGLPYIWPEVHFAVEHELALDLEDLLRRRLLIALKDRQKGLGVLSRAAEIMAELLGWSPEQRAAEERRYRAFVEANSPQLEARA